MQKSVIYSCSRAKITESPEGTVTAFTVEGVERVFTKESLETLLAILTASRETKDAYGQCLRELKKDELTEVISFLQEYLK